MDGLVKGCVVVFGEDAHTIIRVLDSRLLAISAGDIVCLTAMLDG